jgi:beta-galactosidase GanA
MKDSQSQRINYGASYSPLYFSETEWDSDLTLMQGAGMNLIRLGDVHGSWDRIEPRPGEYQLERLADFYQRANQYGIKILISTGASGPPLWLATQHPDISILSNNGKRYPLGSSYHWACIHHPAFLEASESYLKKLAHFVIQHPNHFGWQISNEIGFPFMPAREQGDLGLYCYCDHCQVVFRSWLQKKYKTLEALTTAWQWGTTNFVYNDWGEIHAPESLPSAWSGVTRWIDWRIFWQDAFAQFVARQHNLIRAIDQSRPTSVNTFNFKGYDRFGTYMGLDQWKIAKETDHIGYDLYPGSGDKRKTRPEHNSIFLDHGRSVSESAGTPFWVHEVESGPIGGWLMGPQRNTDEKDILNYMVECIGHNAKLFLYMPWREWAYQPIRWGALVDLDGNPTSRLTAAASIGDLLKDNSQFIMNAKVPQSQVALLESKTNAIFIRGANDEELLFQAQRGSYRAYWEKGFSVDFINEEQLLSDELYRYQHICLPLMGLLSEEGSRHLEEYVHQGGVLIGFSRLATLDTDGWFHHKLPMEGLKQIFGLEKMEADTLPPGKISFEGKEYPLHLNRDKLVTSANTEVLGHFVDGLPAVTLHEHGAGVGIYIATQADSAFVNNPKNQLLGDVIEFVNKRRGIKSPIQISNNQRAIEIDPHILEFGKTSWILFSNYAEAPKDIEFQLSESNREVDAVQMIFPNQSRLNKSQSNGVLMIKLEFQAKEVKIVEIKWI